MHLHLVRGVAPPALRVAAAQRPAKVVTLEVRRQARLEAASAPPLPPQHAA
jgi:hypothetical protein